MKFRELKGLRRLGALMLACLMLIPYGAAFAMPVEQPLTITVSWEDAQGVPQTATAVPLPYPGYENKYWVQVPNTAPFNNLRLQVADPMGRYNFTAYDNIVINVIDAGDNLTFSVPMEIMGMTAEGQPGMQVYLYVSTYAIPPEPKQQVSPVDVPVQYIDESGNTLKNDSFTCLEGDTPVYADPYGLSSEYELISTNPVNVHVDANGARPDVVVFTYRQNKPQVQPVEVTVRYLNKDNGLPVAQEHKVTCNEGYTSVPATPQNLQPDYKLFSSGSVDVYVDANGANPSEVIFYYEYIQPQVQPANVTVRYLDKDNNESVADAHTVTCNEGNTTVPATPYNLQPDYKLFSSGSVDVYVDANGANPSEVIFYYEYVKPAVQPANVTVRYLDKDSGLSVADEHTVTCNEGNTTVPATPYNLKPDYKLFSNGSVDVYVDANGANPSEVIFYYEYSKPAVQPVDVTVRYLDKDNGEAVADQRTVTCYEGTSPIRNNPQNLKPNYILYSTDSVDVTVDEYGANPTEVIFYYEYVKPTVQSVDVPVRYLDKDSGLPVALEYTTNCKEGNTTITANPQNLQPDYRLFSSGSVDVYVDANGANPREVIFYYEYVKPAAQAVDVRVRYLSISDGRQIADDAWVTCQPGTTPVTANPQNLEPNYELAGASTQTVTVDDNGANPAEVVFMYNYVEPVVDIPSVPVTIRYLDEQGISVADDEEKTCHAGTTQIIPNPQNLKENYKILDSTPQYVEVTVNGADKTEIIFRYQFEEPAVVPPTPKIAIVNVVYMVPGNDKPLYSETATCIEGEKNEIRVNLNAVSSEYQLNDAEVKSVTVDSNGVATPAQVVFSFRAKAATYIKVRFVNEEGVSIAADSEWECVEGNNIVEAQPMNLQAGYSLEGDGVKTVTLTADGTLNPPEVVFVYKADPTPTPVVATETPIPTPFPYTITPMDTYGRPKSDSINFRSSPSSTISENRISVVGEKDIAHITGSLKNSANEMWYQAEINGVQGFLRDTVVTLMNDAEINDYLGYTPTPIPEATLVPTPVPDDVIIDLWGVINKGSVNFRKNPDASDNSNRIDQLAKDKKVWVYSAKTVNNVRWYFIRNNGTDGYVSAEYVTLMSGAESETYQDSLKTPMPTQSAVPTRTPTDEPSASPEITETPPTATPTITPTPTPETYKGYALTKTQTALRSGVSETQDSVLYTLNAVTLVWVNAQTYVGDVCWDNVNAFITSSNNPTGYVPDSALNRITVEEAEYYLKVLQQQQTPTPTPTPTAVPQQRTGYAITLGDYVPLRAFPDTIATIDHMLMKDTVVMVYGQEYAQGETWDIVYVSNYWGYVRADQLRMLNELEIKGYEESLKTPTPAPVASPTVMPNTENSLSSFGYINADKVNLRSSTSTSSSRLKVMNRYDFAMVLGKVEASDGTWYKITQGGTEGYVKDTYLNVLTIGELSKFLTSAEYLNANTTTNTGTSDQIQSLEDYNQGTWQNPALSASYEPFNPYTATPDPEKLATPTPTPTLAPYSSESVAPIGGIGDTTPPPENTKTSSSSIGWILAGVGLIGGGGAYYAYTIHQRNMRRQQAVRAQQARQARQAQQQQPQMRAAQNNPTNQQTRAYQPQSGTTAPFMPPQGAVPRPTQTPTGTTRPATSQGTVGDPYKRPDTVNTPLTGNTTYPPTGMTGASQIPVRPVTTATQQVPPVSGQQAAAKVQQTTNPYRPVNRQTAQTGADQTSIYPPVRQDASTVAPVAGAQAAKPSAITTPEGTAQRARRADRHRNADGSTDDTSQNV